MPFVATLSILAAVKVALEALPHTDPAKAALGEKLFERVDYHENRKLREAMTDLTIIKQRVAIIVPGGHSFQNERQARTVVSRRSFSFDILIADRAWTKAGHDAVFGGEKNIGIITMAEEVLNAFVANPQIGLPYVLLQPQQDQQIEIADNDVKDVPGRECLVLTYDTPAGEAVISPTQEIRP